MKPKYYKIIITWDVELGIAQDDTVHNPKTTIYCEERFVETTLKIYALVEVKKIEVGEVNKDAKD